MPLFLEENLEYARRLMRAGIPTELHVYPGARHEVFNETNRDEVERDLLRWLDRVAPQGDAS